MRPRMRSCAPGGVAGAGGRLVCHLVTFRAHPQVLGGERARRSAAPMRNRRLQRRLAVGSRRSPHPLLRRGCSLCALCLPGDVHPAGVGAQGQVNLGMRGGAAAAWSAEAGQARVGSRRCNAARPAQRAAAIDSDASHCCARTRTGCCCSWLRRRPACCAARGGSPASPKKCRGIAARTAAMRPLRPLPAVSPHLRGSTV